MRFVILGVITPPRIDSSGRCRNRAAARHAHAHARPRHLAPMGDRPESRTAAEPTKGTAAAMSRRLTADGSTLGGGRTAPDLGRMQGDGLAAVRAADNTLGRGGEQRRHLYTQRPGNFLQRADCGITVNRLG